MQGARVTVQSAGGKGDSSKCRGQERQLKVQGASIGKVINTIHTYS